MNLDDLQPEDIVEFIHPVTNNPNSGTYGVSRFVQAIKRRNGNRIDIELVNNLGDKTIITEKDIRWDRTRQHKQKEVQV